MTTSKITHEIRVNTAWPFTAWPRCETKGPDTGLRCGVEGRKRLRKRLCLFQLNIIEEWSGASPGYALVRSGGRGREPLFRTDVHHRWSRKEMSPSTGTSYYMGRGPTGRCCSGHVLLFVVRVLCFDPGSKESSKTSQVDGRWTLVGWSAREKQSGQRRPA